MSDDWVRNVSDEAYRVGYQDGQRDEREKIAQAIEARRASWDAAWAAMAQSGATVGPGTVRVAYDESARIARNGGSNDPSN